MTDAVSPGDLFLLDAHGLIFQMYYGVGPMTAPDGRPTNAVYGVTRSLMDLYDRGADYLIATLDHQAPTFRSALDPNYKSHRDPPPDDLLRQEPLIHRVLRAMRVPLLVVPGYEADDIMATVATAAVKRGLNVFLCTADKDCRQLVSDRVKILNLRKPGEVCDPARVEAEWGVRPEQVADYQALVGDPVDNIPGVPGVGPKTAARWIRELGSLDAIIANPDRVSGSPKLREALRRAIADGTLERSRKLVTLARDVPLVFDWEGWRRKDWDGQELLALFQELGFRRFAERVRKTLAANGARKNAELLRLAGVVQERVVQEKAERTTDAASSSGSARLRKDQGHEVGSGTSRRKRPMTSPSLFDATDGAAADAPNRSPSAEQPRPAPDSPDVPASSSQAPNGDTTEPTTGSTTRPDDWSYADYRLIDTPAKFQRFLKQLARQDRIVFDLETTGLDPLLSAIVGYAFCWKAGQAYYLPVRAPEGEPRLDPEQTLAALKPVFENPRIEKRNHNIKFDQLVLLAHGVNLAGVAGDSMIADFLLRPGSRSHSLDELTRQLLGHENIPISDLIGKGKNQLTMDQVPVTRVKDYAAEDADTALRIAEKLEAELVSAGLYELYQKLEVPLIDVLARMEFTGIRIDLGFLSTLRDELTGELARIEQEIHELAGRSFNVNSLRELQKVLFDELKLPVQRRTGIKNEPSTDQESLERLAALGHPLPRKLLAYRQIAKLKNTYVDVLPSLVNPATGRVHTSFNQAAVETGRLSSSDPNLQNIPARTEQGARLRRAFIPAEGWQLLTADYSQIELRLLAHFSGDETLRRAFIERRDVHTAVAAEIFKVPEGEVSKLQRTMAKTVNFGVIYGMSAAGLSARLGIPRAEAEAFIDQYFARYPRVLEYQQKLLARAHATGRVTTLLGHQRTFNPDSIDPGSSYRKRGQAEREAINMEIQGSAADLLKQAMLRVDDAIRSRRMRSRMLLTVHDELVFECPPEEVEPLASLARAEMTAALSLEVPLEVDVAAGPNWLDVRDV